MTLYIPNFGTLLIFLLFILMGVAVHAALATRFPTNTHIKLSATKYIFLLLVVFVSLAGTITHAMLASSYTETKIRNQFSLQTAPPQAIPGKPILLPRGQVFFGGNNGVYNYSRSINGVPQSSLQNAIGYAFFWDSNWIATDIVDTYFWYLPYPFFIPCILHLGAFSLVRTPLYLVFCGSGKLAVTRSFATHAFVSSLYAFALMVLFQSARMLWASDGWNALVYLNHPAYGNTLLYILLGLTIALYIYSIVGTAKLRVVRRKNDRFKRCLHCGYTLENLTDPCPECGGDPNEPALSKLRLRPFLFLGGAAFTFFSPFILANVFDLFV